MKTKAFVISILFIPFLAFAQNSAPLPSAGLTPENPIYFLDRLGEALQEFFTFNPDGKARLQIIFAAERVAEIKVILETKGVDAKGLDVAQSRLQSHLASAATAVADKKSKGEDASALAKELDDGLKTPKSALAQSFKEQERTLEAREDELKTALKAAHRAGNTAEEETLAEELGQVKAQLELLDLKKEDIEDELEAEEEKIEEELDVEHKAREAIREAEEEKQEVLNEAAEEEVTLPASAFAEFDGLLTQAQSAFNTGNFAEAKRLADQTEDAAERVEDTVEELEEQKENKEDAKEAIKEAEEELSEVQSEAEKEGVTIPTSALGTFNSLLNQARSAFAQGNYEEAERLAGQAEESLEDVEDAIEKAEEEKERQAEQLEEEKDED